MFSKMLYTPVKKGQTAARPLLAQFNLKPNDKRFTLYMRTALALLDDKVGAAVFGPGFGIAP